MPTADEQIAEVVSDASEVAARAARMPAFEAAIARVRGRAESGARDVFVEVDSTGRVVDLRLADHAMRRSAATLTRELRSTLRAAEEDARRRTLGAVAELLGDDDPILAQLREASDETPHPDSERA